MDMLMVGRRVRGGQECDAAGGVGIRTDCAEEEREEQRRADDVPR